MKLTTIKRLEGIKDTIIYGVKTVQIRTEKERLQKAIDSKYGTMKKFGGSTPEVKMLESEIKQLDVLYGTYKDYTMKSIKRALD